MDLIEGFWKTVLNCARLGRRSGDQNYERKTLTLGV